MAFDHCILYLDENFAKLRDTKEIQDIQKTIEEAVSVLLSNVAANDARFLSKLEHSGSFYEGTKIIQADEFDFMVNLTSLDGICELVYRDKEKRHVLVRVASPDKDSFLYSWSEFCEEISWPSNLNFVSSTGFAFDKMGLPGAMQAAASEKLDFCWKGDLKVSVDLALAIECKGWPLLTGLFESLIGEGHPAFLIKNKIKSSGFHVVPKLGPLWNISWSRAETVLLKHIFQQNGQAAVSYRVAKLIKETHFVEVIAQSNATFLFGICESSSLKHLLMVLWVSGVEFSTKSCGEILMDLLKLLSDSLKNAYCPQVFANFSTVKRGGGLQTRALALEKCIIKLRDMQGVEMSQVAKTCEDFFREKIPVVFPSPPKKLSSYKITKIQ